MKPTLYVAAVAVLSATAVGGVYAAKSTDNDALAINDAQISLTQAVIAAEQHVGGRASRAEYEHHKGQWLFDVEVVKGRCYVRRSPGTGSVSYPMNGGSERSWVT